MMFNCEQTAGRRWIMQRNSHANSAIVDRVLQIKGQKQKLGHSLYADHLTLCSITLKTTKHIEIYLENQFSSRSYS